MILVLDESGSIGTTKPPATEQVRNAARAFLTPLAGTGSKVAVVEFSTAAHLGVAYQTVTAETIASKFEPYLKNEYDPSGWTNWKDALLLSKKTSDGQPKADLVVFVTDGDPTAYNEGSGQKTNTSNADALNKAIPQANAIKNDHIKIFGVGVGSALNNSDSQNRLKKITGTKVATGDSVADADVIFVQDFGALAAKLASIAREMCRSSVTITKKVDADGDGQFDDDPSGGASRGRSPPRRHTPGCSRRGRRATRPATRPMPTES